MKEKRGKKKGISPVIATTLLIAMVVVIALIIFIWFRGLNQEAVTKFGGTNIDLVCKDVTFSSSYSGGIISLQNTGNVPIYSFQVEIVGLGSQESIDITNITTSWPSTGLTQGGAFSGSLSDTSSAQKITVIPVLRGTTSKGIRTHVCATQYGQTVL